MPDDPRDAIPTGLPEDGFEAPPLGVPDDDGDDAETTGPDAMPGIPGETEPPSSG